LGGDCLEKWDSGNLTPISWQLEIGEIVWGKHLFCVFSGIPKNIINFFF